MEHEHYTYPEAIKWLAKKYNIEIEETEQSDEQKKKLDKRESMFLVSKFAKDYFHDLLMKSQKGRAVGLSYFKERGFREEVIKKFDLGYCKDEWDNFTKAALAKGYDLTYLKETGLTIVKEGTKENKKFDRFKGRVMFPIHSMSGRILGFGGRILTNDKKAAKYLNSPESEIYHKSKILYGLYHAKKEIAKTDNCFLVEGYTDVISFHQSGIENVVASSGTALTPDQIRLINRLTKNITVLFDGDAAGIRASIRGIDLILEQGLNVKVVSFPEGEDPDSFAKKNSNAELKNYLKNEAQDFIGFKVSLLMEEAQNDPVKKAGLIRDIVTSISKIPDGIQREVYVQECARIMDISEQVLFSELAQLIQRGLGGRNYNDSRTSTPNEKHFSKDKEFGVLRAKTRENRTHNIDQVSILEKEIIRILLLYGNETVEFENWVDSHDKYGRPILEKEEYQSTVFNELFLNLQEDETEFSNELFRITYNVLVNQLNQREKIVIDELIMHENEEISGLVTNILMDEEKYILSNWEKKEVFITEVEKILPKLVTDAVLNLRRVLIEKKIKGILEEIQANQSTPDLEEIRNYTELKKLLFEKLNRVV